jgi:tripartite-type tricarboxylate transporter receptor subunit TctC
VFSIPRSGAACALVLLAAAAAPAAAQDAVANFYKGKTLNIVVSVSPGGGIDTFARLMARRIVEHIPGNPQIVVTNMPGAGTKVAAKYLFRVAAKDGTVMGTVLPGALLEPTRIPVSKRDYDPVHFNYIGNGNVEALSTVVRTDAPVKSLDDMYKTELVAGTPGGGSSVHESTMIVKNVLGAKLKVVTGYPGVNQVRLAMQKGEVQGMVGLAFSTVRQFFDDYIGGSKGFKVIAQDNIGGHPILNKAGVPYSISKAKNEADRALIELYQTQASLVRVYIMPPGVPKDRVAAMRKAFIDTIKSKEFQADITKAKAEAIPQTGEEIEALIKKMYASPPELLERLGKAVQG